MELLSARKSMLQPNIATPVRQRPCSNQRRYFHVFPVLLSASSYNFPASLKGEKGHCGAAYLEGCHLQREVRRTARPPGGQHSEAVGGSQALAATTGVVQRISP